ncbi:uracil-DNA glycosylase, partial [Candidatus Woesearchaeota archaeon]|nr:uracil-DNA glycosylase [Candidatus Woesearchaeota archaeon]
MPFDQLKQEYSTCSKCPALCQSRSQVVFGSGNPQAEVLFIGEAPGANEDKQGIPFCGMSGQVLNELLSSVGLSREDIFITNTILCRPENNRNPAKDEVENCRERLDKLIGIMQPKVIVTIGNFA